MTSQSNEMMPLYCAHPDEPVLMHAIFNSVHDAWALNGWWCPKCNKWLPAVGRERKFKPSQWHDLKRRLEGGK